MEDWIGIQPLELVAGFAGGVVRALSRPDITPWQAVASIVVGALCGGYGTPLGTDYLISHNITEPGSSLTLSASFVVGLCGMTIAQGLQAAVSRWLERKLDGGRP